jgi:hypothetical protein
MRRTKMFKFKMTSVELSKLAKQEDIEIIELVRRYKEWEAETTEALSSMCKLITTLCTVNDVIYKHPTLSFNEVNDSVAALLGLKRSNREMFKGEVPDRHIIDNEDQYICREKDIYIISHVSADVNKVLNSEMIEGWERVFITKHSYYKTTATMLILRKLL